MLQPQQPGGYQPGAVYYQQQPQFVPGYQQQPQANNSFGNPQPHAGTNYPAQQPAEKKEDKKGFFAKVKGFFGK